MEPTSDAPMVATTPVVSTGVRSADVPPNGGLSVSENPLAPEVSYLKQQLAEALARLGALETKVAHIEPLVEARAVRTERIVLETQAEFRRWQKQFTTHEDAEMGFHRRVEGMLSQILEKI